MKPEDLIQPGDCLLYKPSGLFGKLIAIKTWHAIAHAEIYRGKGLSVASRDGLGVGLYPFRVSGLGYVLRPIPKLDLDKADKWFESVKGQPYGWADLLAFLGVGVDGNGMVCSPFATDYYRAAGMDPFNSEPSIKIAPFEFLLSNCFKSVDLSAPVPKES